MTVDLQPQPEPHGLLKLRLWVRLLRAVRAIEVELRRRLRPRVRRHAAASST